MSRPTDREIYDPGAFRAELDQVLRRSSDPHVHDVVWACIEGRTTRTQLRQDQAFAAELGALYRDRFAALAERGLDLAALRAHVREIAEADDARADTAYADQVTVARHGRPS